jgi:hypothetical protein
LANNGLFALLSPKNNFTTTWSFLVFVDYFYILRVLTSQSRPANKLPLLHSIDGDTAIFAFKREKRENDRGY